MNRLSLFFEPDQVFRAEFRTTLANAESVPGEPGVKYNSRIDSIQFSIKRRRYRVSESNLRDASGKIVMSYSSGGDDAWKPLVGRTATRLFEAASQLQPFGIWRVVTYRYASGEPAADQDSAELRSLIGSSIRFGPDRLVAGRDTCSSPVISTRTVTNEELVDRIGASLQSLGLPSEKLEAILLVCEARENFPSQTMILRLPGDKALMLWEGVFLELERTGNLLLP